MAETRAKARLSTKEACEYLDVSRPTLYRWARAEKVRVFRKGKFVRWWRPDLDRLLEKYTRVQR